MIEKYKAILKKNWFIYSQEFQWHRDDIMIETKDWDTKIVLPDWCTYDCKNKYEVIWWLALQWYIITYT